MGELQPRQRIQRTAAALMPPRRPSDRGRVLRRFSPDLDVPIAASSGIDGAGDVAEIEGGWRLSTKRKRVFTLFRIPASDLDGGLLVYRAQLRSHDADTNGYLELWCRVPGDGQYFAKDSRNATKGERRWRSYEVPYLLPTGPRADVITLNLTCEGPGTIDIRNVELVWHELPDPLAPRELPRSTLRMTYRSLRFVALSLINAAFVGIQLALTLVAAIFGVEIPADRLLTWWPKNTAPVVGKRAG